MTSAEAFICPRCSRICFHPLEVFFRWCPECGTVTGIPRACEHPPPERTPLRDLHANQDRCLIAIENGQSLPTKVLQALPPFRATMVAHVANLAGIGLEDGTYEQLWKEAVAVGGSGTLGDWWLKEYT